MSEFIGKGGFAKVYKQDDGRVIKKLNEKYLNDEKIKKRFIREYDIMNDCSDNFYVADVYDLVVNDNEVSYKMNFFDQTMCDYMGSNDLNIIQKMKLIESLLYAVQSIHNRNIIHRDLKPNNIYIDHNSVVLADFGLGKDFNQEYTLETKYTRVYTPVYTAPEQSYALKDTSKKSDIYSTGIIINFILTGEATNRGHELNQLVNVMLYYNPDDRVDISDAIILFKNFKNNIFIGELFSECLLQEIDMEKVESILLEFGADKIVDIMYNWARYGFDIFSNDFYENRFKMKESLKKIFSGFIIKYPDEGKKIFGGIKDVLSGYHCFSDDDYIADIAYDILKHKNIDDVELYRLSLETIKFIAKDVNRFYVQRMVCEIKDENIIDDQELLSIIS